MPLDLCPRCGKMHYRTDPCPADVQNAVRVLNAAPVSSKNRAILSTGDGIGQLLGEDRVLSGPGDMKPKKRKRGEGRRRPGYMRDYMRKYRAKKKGK